MKPIAMMIAVTLVVGCAASVRPPAREATLGVLDAVERPDASQPLARKIRTLAEKYVDDALEAGSPPGIDAIARRATEGVLDAAAARAPEERALVRGLVRDAVQTAALTAKQELAGAPQALRRSVSEVTTGVVGGVTDSEPAILGLLKQGSGEVGKTVAREAGGEFLNQLESRLGENGPLAQALTGSAARISAGVVQGATQQLAAELADCQSADPEACKSDLVRRFSRSVAMGITEGVGRKLAVWEIILALGIGAGVALGGSWLVRRLTQRRSGGLRARRGAFVPVARRRRPIHVGMYHKSAATNGHSFGRERH